MADITRDTDRDGEMGADELAFSITSPIRLDQLNAEVTAAMNWRNPADLCADGSTELASEANPVTVWVGRTDIDPDVFISATEAHEPDEEWTDAPVTSEPAPTLTDVRAKLAAGEVLDLAEVSAMLAEMTG